MAKKKQINSFRRNFTLYYEKARNHSFDDKTIIVTFEMPITNTIKVNTSNNLFN